MNILSFSCVLYVFLFLKAFKSFIYIIYIINFFFLLKINLILVNSLELTKLLNKRGIVFYSGLQGFMFHIGVQQMPGEHTVAFQYARCYDYPAVYLA